MPFLFSKSKVRAQTLVLVLAFGEVSKLELVSIFEKSMVSVHNICPQIVKVIINDLNSALKTLPTLSGIRKAILEICKFEPHEDYVFSCDSSFDSIIQSIDNKSTVGISYYCMTNADIASFGTRLNNYILSRIKENKIKKVKVIHPHGNEIFINDIQKRKILDFVCFKEGKDYRLGFTFFVPDTARPDWTNQEPVFLPKITMSPTLARVLINLSGVKTGQKLLDPFCGSGTILVEALKLGINCFGIDKDTKRVRITTNNLRFVQTRFPIALNTQFKVRVGNALYLREYFERKSIDAIVTEPILLPTLYRRPSRKDAERMIANSRSIYLAALKAMSDVLSIEGRIVIVTPSIITKEGEYIRVNLSSQRISDLKVFQPSSDYQFEYPLHVEGQTTRWIKREVYVFQH